MLSAGDCGCNDTTPVLLSTTLLSSSLRFTLVLKVGKVLVSLVCNCDSSSCFGCGTRHVDCAPFRDSTVGAGIMVVVFSTNISVIANPAIHARNRYLHPELV